MVVATHDRTTLARADHALLLESGRVAAEGPPHHIAAEQVRRAAAALVLDRPGGPTARDPSG